MKKTVLVCLVMLVVFSGCAAIDKMRGKDETPPQAKFETLNEVFYGFPDVPVPKELTFSPERSFIYETQALKVGVLVLSGNVELQSLENYFKTNMAKNGWRLVNSFKFKDVVLNFTKEDKTCNIKMARDMFNTNVEIWVGPSDKSPVQKGNAPK